MPNRLLMPEDLLKVRNLKSWGNPWSKTALKTSNIHWRCRPPEWPTPVTSRFGHYNIFSSSFVFLFNKPSICLEVLDFMQQHCQVWCCSVQRYRSLYRLQQKWASDHTCDCRPLNWALEEVPITSDKVRIRRRSRRTFNLSAISTWRVGSWRATPPLQSLPHHSWQQEPGIELAPHHQ